MTEAAPPAAPGLFHTYRPPPGPLQIVHLDDDLVVVNKPSGLLSVPGRGDGKQDCAESRMAAALGWVRAVHRIDMDTSGLLVLARNAPAHRTLGAAFAERSIKKTYVCEVWGCPDAPSGRIESPLLTDWPNRPRQKIDWETGKPAKTEWTLEARTGPGARLILHPLTGRSHQLRVHLASIGHPILGDPFYAHPEARQSAPRLLLHAAALAFDHPVTGSPLQLRSAPGF